MSPAEKRLEVHDAGKGFYRVILHYGFMEEVDIPARSCCASRPAASRFNMMSTSFFLGRQKLIASKEHPGMALWREQLFAWMMQELAKARWSSSSCRPTAWSSSAASCRSKVRFPPKAAISAVTAFDPTQIMA